MRTHRYVAWLHDHVRAVVLAAVAAVGVSAYLAVAHLPLQSDFSALLPADAPAVRDAARLAQRMPSQDTMLMLIVAPDPATREVVATRAAARLRAIDPALIAHVEADDADTRAFVRAHRHLFAPLPELERARDALATHVADAKLRANPMYISLEAEPPDTALDELRAKHREAEARLARSANVSADGRSHVIVIRTAFRATDVDKDRTLMTQLDAIAGELRAAHPGATVGFAGGPVVTIAEHRAMSRGMLLSSAITFALVALVLLVHLRSLRMLVLISANIVAATVVSFGVAAIAVGHLNPATAFLGAIIAGNGVNYGILLVARYLEERAHAGPVGAMAIAIRATLRPTLVASLGAAVAYGALVATQFRGFAEFAVIGGAGMLVSWVASFTLLPALVLRFAGAVRREPAPWFGAVVMRLFGFRRPGVVLVGATVVMVAAGGITWRYLASDPYEYDLGQLRSRSPEALAARGWLAYADRTFERGLAGLGGQTFIAVDREDQVPQVVDALQALAAREPIVGSVRSILDVVPRDQERKLAVLAEIRALIDGVTPLLDDAQRAELLAHRPADDLAAITPAALPAAIRAKLAERDGRVGHILAVRPGQTFDEHDGRDLIAFAGAIRTLELANGETVSTAGAAVLFADVLVQIQRDGPLITAIALLGLIAVVTLVAGPSRRSVAVLVATAAGSLAMIAGCAIAGIKINFFDFIALPITLGLGVDYAINVAERAAACERDPRAALRLTGGTVLVCSLTTVIGYASLLVSDNLAIRGFGLASLIGEVTSVIAALVIVPAIVAWPALRRDRVGRVGELTPSRAQPTGARALRVRHAPGNGPTT